MTAHFENGKTLVIEAKNNNKENVYIQTAKLNGKVFTRNYLTCDELVNGGRLEYQMGDQPATNRGILNSDFPYSASKRQ